MLDKRTSLAQALLAERQLDALLITRPADLRYLCGFTGSSGALILTSATSCFLTDSRYVTQAAREVRVELQREFVDRAEGIVAALAELGGRRVGYQAEDLTCAAFDRLQTQSRGGVEWVALAREIAPLRGVKDHEEVERIVAASAIAEAALEEIVPLLRPGISEQEVALQLEWAMRRRGAEEKAFDLIVASGERGALPHGRASAKVLAEGELITIDFGARRDGYCSDETVTLALGPLDAELRKIYETVYEAQQRAFAAIRPGVPLSVIDAAARDHIVACGYGSYFGHGLGHGIGIEVHEYPTVSSRSVDLAQEGMVFTVEPGIYLPGRGGVRLEDMVLVTADGCRRLTTISKAFRQLPV